MSKKPTGGFGRLPWLLFSLGRFPFVLRFAALAAFGLWLVTVMALAANTPLPRHQIAGWLVCLTGLSTYISATMLGRPSYYPSSILAAMPIAGLLSLVGLAIRADGLSIALAAPLLATATITPWYVLRFSQLTERHWKRLSAAAGGAMPDFALPDSDGRLRHLAELLGQGPALFLFYRGDW